MGVEKLSQYAFSFGNHGRMPTHQRSVSLGGDFVELVAPFEHGTTVGRLLAKRGEGGYMVIMQTDDAVQRRDHVEKHNLAKVIFTHDHDDVACTQYHPKGIKGTECAIYTPHS